MYEYLSIVGVNRKSLLHNIAKNRFLCSCGLVRELIFSTAKFHTNPSEILSTFKLSPETKEAIDESEVILMVHPCDRIKLIMGLVDSISTQRIVIPVYGDITDYQTYTEKNFDKFVVYVNTANPDAISIITREVSRGSKLLIFADLPSRKMWVTFGKTKQVTLFDKVAHMPYGPFLLASKFASKVAFVAAKEDFNQMSLIHESLNSASLSVLMKGFIQFYEAFITNHTESVLYLSRLPTYHYHPTSPADIRL
ncbi:hypothetical protein [Enterovibrio coralii]|uniref:hypothetical protein n=1 Tax=Enterovibrio coralii TaxID=294935 RepID=UPI0012FB9186|nr:hypothetical protein [Enterovibrio coralii]